MASKSKTEARAAERAARLEELKREAKAQERRRNLMVGGVVAAVVAIVATVLVLVTLGNQDVDATAAGESDYGLVVGSTDAPREVVIYEDFLCPFCGQLELTVRERLDAAVEAGEANVEYRPLGFLGRIDDYSPEAANAFAVVLDASGPEVARKYHDLLFDEQPPESGPFPDTDDLVELAVEAGAREGDVRPGIEDMAFEGWVDAANEAASQEGVNSTPSVFVDGERIEADTVPEVADAMVGPVG